ncbi:MAG: asparagine synthase (glutamine-hydrolyzing) [Thermoanaerobaculia bacterium]|nr:asparagine synthase (glutamine-hydrolyzing) [Thermoanaerobaculia bacterium]
MCGIAGIVGRPPEDPTCIDRMVDILRHRGPDDRGVWRSGNAHIGHRRLSILDLSEAGRQPMVLGDLVLTYNGEIYNFQELRRRFEGPYQSNTDSEVLLHAYRGLGPDCLHELNGMFAFAVWDEAERRLFAARDRLGIKPLYYRPFEGGLAFASEILPLLELGPAELDDEALTEYLNWGWVPTPKTPWRGVYKLPAGEYLTWQDGDLRLQHYWTPAGGERTEDPDEALQQLDDLLRRLVTEHTLADVPVGIFLSGGVDSATVTSYVENARTYTLGQPQRGRDEAPAARRVAEHLGTEHHEEIVDLPELDQAVDTIIETFGEPFGDSAAVSVWMVSRMARRHVTVALSGEGGDEAFCGYRWYGRAMREGSSLLHRLVAPLTPMISRTGRSMRRRAAEGLERWAAFVGPFSPWQTRSLLGERLAAAEHDFLAFARHHWRPELEFEQRLQWIDMHTYLPDGLLTKVDRASMAHSLEVRPPLLDHRLVEWAFACAPGLKWNPTTDQGKHLLRCLMRDRLPPGHLDRPKRGFNLAIRDWSKKQPDILQSALRRLDREGLIRSRRIVSLTHEQIWTLVVLDRWLTRHVPSYG